jgi:membrane protease YdiL (CAAX protease family)
MPRIQRLDRHPVLTYCLLVFALSWTFWIPMAIARDTTSFRFIVLATLGNIMPSLVGILLTGLYAGRAGLSDLFRRLGQVRAPLVWYAAVLFLPPVLWLVALGIPVLLGLATIAVQFTIVGLVGPFVAGFGEELGWRGFALPRLQSRQSALSASLLLAVPWGLWHIPLNIAIGLTPLTAAGLVLFVLFFLHIVAYSVLYTWVYNNTRGSLFMVVLFHAMFDLVGYTIVAPRTTWLFPVLYLLLLWAVAAVVIVMTGGRLSRAARVVPASGPGEEVPAGSGSPAT